MSDHLDIGVGGSVCRVGVNVLALPESELQRGHEIKGALARLGIDLGSVRVLSETELSQQDLVEQGVELIGTINSGGQLNIESVVDILHLRISEAGVIIDMNVLDYPGLKTLMGRSEQPFALAFEKKSDRGNSNTTP